MIGGLPDSTARAIGEMIVHTLEALFAASLACVVLAAVFGVLAHRSAGRRRTVCTCLAVAAGLIAFVPAVIVVYAVNH